MTCQELADLLGDYCSGDLPAERRDGADSHLRVCPPCVALLESYRITIHLARRLPLHPLPPAFVERLRGTLREAGGSGKS